MSRSDPAAFRMMCFMLSQWIESPKNQTALAALLNTTIDEYHKNHPEITVSQTLVEASPGFAQSVLKALLPQGQAETAKTEFEYVVVSKSSENPQSQKRFSPVRPASAVSVKSNESVKEVLEDGARSQPLSPVVSEREDVNGWNDELPPISSKNFYRAPASSVRHSAALLQRSKSPTCCEEGIDAGKAKEAFNHILNQKKYWPEKSISCLLWDPEPTLAVFIIQALVKKLDSIVHDILETDESNITGEFAREDCLAIFKELSDPISTEKAKQIYNCIATAQVKLHPNRAAVSV
ncbi:MAG: hypothetical protein A3E82_01310 [Gammaproteobacteria bacterium RIFCSPHIGHO2_12_FULL_38_11]|nr:MAG: hypothetical protein A3E82_01310 [Gammaproteobacteria bacterium RIFCSPHIGHO2_12_FULL_38_11]